MKWWFLKVHPNFYKNGWWFGCYHISLIILLSQYKQTCQKGPSSSPYGSSVGCYLLTILALMLWKWIIEELRGWNVHCFYADSMNRWPHLNGNIGWGNLPRIDLNSFLNTKNSGCQRQNWDFTVYWNWPYYLLNHLIYVLLSSTSKRGVLRSFEGKALTHEEFLLVVRFP